MQHSFHTKQWVPYPLERVFSFFADPGNLPLLMPGWQRARIEQATFVAPPDEVRSASVVAGKGSLITISFRPVPWIPVRLEWDALIVDFRWNNFFCDEQQRGPFKSFRHCHWVREEGAGTVISDAVEYELPLGQIGDMANGLAVKRQIRMLFRYRQKMLPVLLTSRTTS